MSTPENSTGAWRHGADVARVDDGAEELETSALWNGQRTVLLVLRKQSGTNTVAVIDSDIELMKEFSAELPEGYTL